jgi:hypothetical protein
VNSPRVGTDGGESLVRGSPPPGIDNSWTLRLRADGYGHSARDDAEVVNDAALNVDGAEDAKQPGYRLYLLHLLPTAVLLATIVGLIWSGAPGRPLDLGKALETARSLDIRDALLLLVAAIVLSLIIQPLQFALIRALEGYWGATPAGRLLAHLGVRWQKWRYDRLIDARGNTHQSGTLRAALAEQREQAATERLDQYPHRDRLLPTRLGNILRAAEDRAGNRYGLGAVTIWPRLYPLVSGRHAGILLEHRHELDVATRFCVTLLIDAVVVTGLLIPYGRWSLLGLLPLALAWLSYEAALAAAGAYGVTVEATFDLYRFELLKALHLPLPPDGNSERRLNEIVSGFLQREDGWTLGYRHADSELVEGLATIAASQQPGNRRRRGQSRNRAK